MDVRLTRRRYPDVPEECWAQNRKSNSTSRSNSPTFYGSSLNLPKLSTTRDTSLPDLTAL